MRDTAEPLEQPVLLGRVNADAGIGDRQFGPAGRAFTHRRYRDGDAAVQSEFDGV